MLAILTDKIATYSRPLSGFVLHGKPPALSAAVLDHIHQLLSNFLHKKRPAIIRRSDRMLCKSGGSYLEIDFRFFGDACDGGDDDFDIYRFPRHARHRRHLFEKVGAIFINEIAAFSKRPSI